MNNEKMLEFKISILYFLEEACGYRHSLHWLRRWMETKQDSDLQRLIVEVGRENFFDFERLLQAIDGDSDARWEMIGLLSQRGIIVPDGWNNLPLGQNIKLTPAPESMIYNIRNGENNFDVALGNSWAIYNWIKENKKTHDGIDALELLNYAMQLLIDSKDDIYKICHFVRMLLGKNTLIENVINADTELFANNVGEYFAGKEWVAKNLMLAIQNGPEENWKDALSRNQVKSKIWLLDKLEKTKWFRQTQLVMNENPAMILVGGWVGLLPFVAATRKQKLGAIINVDIDESTHWPAKILNDQHYEEFKNLAKDIREIDFSKYKKDFVIVDTIVEHFKDHNQWLKTLPAGTKVVLQGNDMFDVPDHVNCHRSLDEFVAHCDLSNIIWQGELTLPGCTRFMVIGTT